jgi:RimJ/RimL family protein N-acetyltransferase
MSQSESVRLRDVLEEDLTIFFEHQADPVANRMADFPPRDREAFMAHWARLLADEAITKKTILVDGQVAGNILGFDWDGRREVGYWLGREYWGRGAATNALAQFLETVKRRPLHARVARHNLGSLRVLEKCGFAVLPDGEAPDPPGGDESVFLRLD